MSRQRYAARNQNAVSFKKPTAGLGPVSNTIVLIVLACVLGLLYLTQVTKTISYGYKINDLRTQSQSLQSEHEDLEVSSARLQALDRAKNSQVASNLVSVAPAGTVQN
jgi:outer membrane murein-binding lipoprotein Lpp